MALDDRTLRIVEQADRALDGIERQTVTAMEDALQTSYNRLEKELLAKYRQNATNLDLLPNQRKLLILGQLKANLDLIGGTEADGLKSSLTSTLKQSSEEGAALAKALAKSIGNEDLGNFDAIPLEALRFQAEQGIDRLIQHGKAFAGRASSIVEIGISTGAGPKKVAGEMRRQLGITKGRAEAIARTEALNSHNQAAQAAYQRAGLEYFQIISTQDARTCPICAARNMRVYKMGEATPPQHPLCRCFSLPWKSEWQELGLSGDEWASDFRSGAIAELESIGRKPDNGPSPFEKAAGLPAPKAIWSPGAAPVPPTPKPTPPPTPEPVPPQPLEQLGAKTELAQIWAKSWTGAPEDLMRLVAQYDQPDRAVPPPDANDADAFAIDGKIHMGPRYSPDDPGGQAVWKHEYGHHLDSSIGKRRTLSAEDSLNAEFRKEGLDGVAGYFEALDTDRAAAQKVARRIADRTGAQSEFLSDIRSKLSGMVGPDGKPTDFVSSTERHHDAYRADELRLLDLAKSGWPKMPDRELKAYKGRGFIDRYLEVGDKDEAVMAAAKMKFRDGMEADVDAILGSGKRDTDKAAAAAAKVLADRAAAVPGLAGELLASAKAQKVEINKELIVLAAVAPNHPDTISMLTDKIVLPNDAAISRDLIGSVTRNVVGVGHTEDYYDRDYYRSRNTETFANITAIYSSGHPLSAKVLEYLLPDGYNAYKKELI
jgi:SPP1 gp7 family putative phage head morphogenesis protein